MEINATARLVASEEIQAEKSRMNRMTDGTEWRETPGGIIAVRGGRTLHLLGTSVDNAAKARKLLAERSFDSLVKAAKPAPGSKNTYFIKL